MGDTSSSPKSGDTGSGGSPTLGETQEIGDKRRSRKQKPRRVFQWTEEIGGHESPRNCSPGLPEQTEPEDLTVFRNNQENIRESLSREHDIIQEYQRQRIISQYSIEAYKVKEEDPTQQKYANKDVVKKVNNSIDLFNHEEKANHEDEPNRPEEGFASVSDPHFPRGENIYNADMDEDEDDDDDDDKRGVSPPKCNIPFYNPFSSHPVAIQLGLANTTMPIPNLDTHAKLDETRPTIPRANLDNHAKLNETRPTIPRANLGTHAKQEEGSNTIPQANLDTSAKLEVGSTSMPLTSMSTHGQRGSHSEDKETEVEEMLMQKEMSQE